MQKSVAIVLIIAAFLAGALADRVLRWATSPDDLAAAPPAATSTVATTTAPTNTNTGQRESWGTTNESTTWDMPSCLASANGRGMTQQEATHACQEILR